MNVEAAVEKLAGALFRIDTRHPHGLAGMSYDDAAADLLQVVREIVAEELQRTYAEDRITVEKMTPVERLTCFVVKMEDLVARADALKHPRVAFDGMPALGGDDAPGGG